MRTKYIELPSIAELEETLATESQRPVPSEKSGKHFASLTPFITFLNSLHIDSSEITLEKTWQEVRMLSEKIINETSLRISASNKDTLLPLAHTLYDYLAEEDEPTPVDIIITPGAKTTTRVEKTIELYKKNLSSKILFTGGTPLYAKNKPEAEIYKEIAIQAGIPAEAIITESHSITVADNIRSSLNLLDKLRVSYKSIIIINSPYTQRRGYSHVEKYTPAGTNVYRVNAPTRQGLRQDDWFTNEEGIFYVLTEYYKLWFGLAINTN